MSESKEQNEQKVHISFSNQQLKALILPLIVEQFLAITVGLADSVMVASVGEAAVSAVSLVDSVNVLIFYGFSALATGGAVEMCIRDSLCTFSVRKSIGIEKSCFSFEKPFYTALFLCI